METQELLNSIQDKTSCKLVKRNCKKIAKKLSFKSEKDTGLVTELAVLLYILDMYNEAIDVCDLLSDVEFTGNYTLWSNIEDARTLKIRILKEQNSNINTNIILNTIIPYLHPELYYNQVKCLELYDRNIKSTNYIGWKLLKLEKMIYYLEIPDFPIDRETTNEEIIKLKNELKNLITN